MDFEFSIFKHLKIFIMLFNEKKSKFAQVAVFYWDSRSGSVYVV